MIATSLNAHDWIEALALQAHPEGGFFREVYRSPDTVAGTGDLSRFGGARSVCTSIFYLLESGDFSAFHRIKSDEIWHFYAGGPLELHILNGAAYSRVVIGIDVRSGESPQYVVPAGAWFASRPLKGSQYSLLGCTVSPGFDFADFEMGRRAELLREYPGFEELIHSLTRN
jgi:predicted cupin superfamily sugar epimerase